MDDQLRLFEIADYSDNEPLGLRYSITTFGADFDVAGLVRRLDQEKIIIPPFQRRYVWNLSQASKFVESLILGLPVPSIFLAQEKDSKKYLVIDGQQRLLSLLFFYKELFDGGTFKLIDVQKDLLGKKMSTLTSKDRATFEDSIIHTLVVRQDQPDDGNTSIFQIFERLNSTGRPLSPQEVRACVFHGPYQSLLVRLTRNQGWRHIMGARTDNRLKEEELILRFFALFHQRKEYSKPMKEFLNKHMGANRNFEKYPEKSLEELFQTTIEFLSIALGNKAFHFRNGPHAAFLDSIMVATADRLKEGRIDNMKSFRTAHRSLIENPTFKSYIEAGTSDETSVSERIKLAVAKFKTIE